MGLKTVISTSTAISKAQCDAFYAKYKIPISQAYGIIEIGLPMINFNKAEEHPDAVGHSLPDYEIGILSDSFEQLEQGAIGNLGIKGPGMFDAYLSPPLLRKEILKNEYLMTGDLASMDEDGLVRIEGRKKSMINVSGNKVFPVEVEQVLNSHQDIILSRVSGFNHRLMGEMVFAELVIETNASRDKEAIISYCRERLTTYKIPQKILSNFLYSQSYPFLGGIIYIYIYIYKYITCTALYPMCWPSDLPLTNTGHASSARMQATPSTPLAPPAPTSDQSPE